METGPGCEPHPCCGGQTPVPCSMDSAFPHSLPQHVGYLGLGVDRPFQGAQTSMLAPPTLVVQPGVFAKDGGSLPSARGPDPLYLRHLTLLF